jgi:hypothetical protein
VDVIVNGTNADDDISVIGNGEDDFTVSVNAGPAIQYNNMNELTIEALAGDDDVEIELNSQLNLDDNITVDGGPSSGGGRSLRPRDGPHHRLRSTAR